VVIQFAKDFIPSLNKLPSSERKRSKPYLQALYNWMSSLTNESHLASIPVSNCFIFRERGIMLDRLVHPHRVYRVQIENFNLFFSVSGQMPLICRFLLIEGH